MRHGGIIKGLSEEEFAERLYELISTVTLNVERGPDEEFQKVDLPDWCQLSLDTKQQIEEAVSDTCRNFNHILGELQDALIMLGGLQLDSARKK